MDKYFLSNLVLRFLIYSLLVIFCFFYLIPLYVMVVNSFKALSEIHRGDMLSLPEVWTLEAWLSAWSHARVGVSHSGLKPFFFNSVMIAAPAVLIITLLGAFNGYVLTLYRFKGSNLVFIFLLLSCFIPYQIVLIPMAEVLGFLKLSGTVTGLVFIYVVYGLGFGTLFFRNFYANFPIELKRAAEIDGASFMQIFFKIMLPNSIPIIAVTVIWQFTTIWNEFLFGSAFADFDSIPMQVALNNIVASSHRVKEYNVHFAGAIIASIPTLIIYLASGRYFVRGLMAGINKS